MLLIRDLYIIIYVLNRLLINWVVYLPTVNTMKESYNLYKFSGSIFKIQTIALEKTNRDIKSKKGKFLKEAFQNKIMEGF